MQLTRPVSGTLEDLGLPIVSDLHPEACEVGYSMLLHFLPLIKVRYAGSLSGFRVKQATRPSLLARLGTLAAGRKRLAQTRTKDVANPCTRS
jgi:hypothetical protein